MREEFKKEPNKDIINKINIGLLDWIDEMKDEIYDFVDLLKEAKSINEVMIYKKELLTDILDTLPLGPDTCYFCLETKRHKTGSTRCDNCIYGEEYGICTKNASVYDEICRKLNDVRNFIYEEYWREMEFIDKIKQKPEKYIVENILVLCNRRYKKEISMKKILKKQKQLMN